MRYMALATDFDGTLTSSGRVAPATVAALERLTASGRKCVLVTGRRLGDLLEVCSCIDSFDHVVAENGALLYRPSTRESTLIAAPVSGKLVEALRRRNVHPMEVGEAIISTSVANDALVLDAIRETGLESHLFFNRDSVMVLPPGVTKASGLRRALRELKLSPHEVVGVGDAENDHSLLQDSECSVAVSNAVESIRSAAAIVTKGAAGDGVIELIDRLIATDLSEADARLTHRHLALGKNTEGGVVRVPPYGHNILIAGASGSGKSTLASGFIERLGKANYQVCIIDPEGDYVGLPHLVTLGDETRIPTADEVTGVLRDPGVNVNLNLLGVPLVERPDFFKRLLPVLHAMRTETSRPHWLVIDEAHHLIPATEAALPPDLPAILRETILITVRPDHLARAILPTVDVLVAVGPTPDATVEEFTAIGRASLPGVDWEPREHRVACWFTRDEGGPFPMDVIHGQEERIRHHRKYARGELGDRGFFFRGPGNRLNVSVQNLATFCQTAETVDDATWLYHLERGDYSSWFEIVIKDDEIATLVRGLERRKDVPAADSRLLVSEAIAERYSLPV